MKPLSETSRGSSPASDLPPALGAHVPGLDEVELEQRVHHVGLVAELRARLASAACQHQVDGGLTVGHRLAPPAQRRRAEGGHQLGVRGDEAFGGEERVAVEVDARAAR